MGKCKKSFSHLAGLSFTRAPWAWKAAKVKKSPQPSLFQKTAEYREQWSSRDIWLTNIAFVYLPKATGTLQSHTCSLSSDQPLVWSIQTKQTKPELSVSFPASWPVVSVHLPFDSPSWVEAGPRVNTLRPSAPSQQLLTALPLPQLSPLPVMLGAIV